MNTLRESFKNKIAKPLLFMALDAIFIFTVFFVFISDLEAQIPFINMYNKYLIFAGIILFKIVVYYFLKLYWMIVDYAGLYEMLKVVVGVSITNLCLYFVFLFFGKWEIEWFRLFYMIPIEAFFIGSVRISKRIFVFTSSLLKRKDLLLKTPTLIIGAGAGGKLVLNEIASNPNFNNRVIGFVDDSKDKISKSFNGYPILGMIEDVSKFIDLYKIKEVIIAIADLSQERLSEIIRTISEKEVKIRRLPLMKEIGPNQSRKIVEVKIEDLLNRGVIELDSEGVNAFIENKIVLITGAGGSIGSELCDQILSYNPRKIILFDIYENTTYDTQLHLLNRVNLEKRSTKIEVYIGSVYNQERLRSLFVKHDIQLVFHAAAYKHVPLMEDSPQEAMRTNIIGTFNVAKMCDHFGVEKMVLVSSDKAVRPTNVMGATKSFAEKIIKYFDSISKTNYSAVRFGNVLGSHGSVVPLFQRQIEKGGPITITHSEITRFFMTIPEAVSLILQSGAFARGGEIFILDMGQPVKIYDLAVKMIRLSGLVPNQDIQIQVTGLRPGEKLYEELLVDPKTQIKTENDLIFIETNTEVINVETIITQIVSSLDALNEDQVKEYMHELIDSYVIDRREPVK